jgi:hypothetical protein
MAQVVTHATSLTGILRLRSELQIDDASSCRVGFFILIFAQVPVITAMVW